MLDCEDGRSNFTRGSKSGSLLFTYEHLRKKDLEFIRGLKISDTIEIEGGRIEIAHAAMDNDRYYFDGNDGHTADIFPQMKCDYLLTGHSHKQYIKQNAEKTIINPGSVGIPQDGTRNPKYALLDVLGGTVSCQFREVPYDMTDAIHAQFVSGLVDCAKYWAIGILYDIITGEECVLKLLETVEKTGDFANEEVWRLSAIGLGMKLTEQEILECYKNGKCKNQTSHTRRRAGVGLHSNGIMEGGLCRYSFTGGIGAVYQSAKGRANVPQCSPS